eukprot:1148411-Pelagomonas_calceolata.AAC.2
MLAPEQGTLASPSTGLDKLQSVIRGTPTLLLSPQLTLLLCCRCTGKSTRPGRPGEKFLALAVKCCAALKKRK